MTATYNVISTQTTNSGATVVTFNNIPSTFTDLVIIGNVRYAVSGDDLGLRFNGDTGDNYYHQQIITETSNPAANDSGGLISSFRVVNNLSNDKDTAFEINIFNYANTSNMKPVISRWGGGSSYFGVFGGGWTGTNAINSISIIKFSSGEFGSDSMFTLIGIKAE